MKEFHQKYVTLLMRKPSLRAELFVSMFLSGKAGALSAHTSHTLKHSFIAPRANLPSHVEQRLPVITGGRSNPWRLVTLRDHPPPLKEQQLEVKEPPLCCSSWNQSGCRFPPASFLQRTPLPLRVCPPNILFCFLVFCKNRKVVFSELRLFNNS